MPENFLLQGGYNSYNLCSVVYKFNGLISSFFQLKSSKRSKGASTDFYGQVLVLWSLVSELHEMWISLLDQEDRGLKSSRTGIELMLLGIYGISL